MVPGLNKHKSIVSQRDTENPIKFKSGPIVVSFPFSTTFITVSVEHPSAKSKLTTIVRYPLVTL